ncbi:O-methyltransferase involved in polyketide biosynthesis [Rhodoligotrophos appendicifer]|uniref:class I SAM-dependent methyltransferase n=1 Tax=Rhodoligotrophos appendicifer TaxID=987056 RepID=UPI001184D2F8|nr:class I SAM-dependent methyltransferase [Rhodoligotrophos appendicifer]
MESAHAGKAKKDPRKRVKLTGARETLLITLYAKALESRSNHSVLKDHYADEAVRRLDYDFAKLAMGASNNLGLALRAKWFDDRTADFIARNPKPIILNLGCGLDTRVLRVSPPPSVRWFDVDFPDVIELRRSVIPERRGCSMIASSVTDPGWLEHVPNNAPAMIVAEGLLPYIKQRDVLSLLRRLIRHFPSGELAFDAYNALGLRLIAMTPAVRATGAELYWTLEGPEDLEHDVPGLRFLEETNGYDPALTVNQPWLYRMVMSAWSQVPMLRRLGRMVRYEF